MPATVYNRTQAHEIIALKELISLFIETKDVDYKDEHTFINEKMRAIMNTIAIRKFGNDFHGIWSKVYDRFNRLTGRDIRKEFENEPTHKYENRLDYTISKYKKELIQAMALVILEN